MLFINVTDIWRAWRARNAVFLVLGGLLAWYGGPLRHLVCALHEAGHLLMAGMTGGQILAARHDALQGVGGWPEGILFMGYPFPPLVSVMLLQVVRHPVGWVLANLLALGGLLDIIEDLGRGDGAVLGAGAQVLWGGWALLVWILALRAVR